MNPLVLVPAGAAASWALVRGLRAAPPGGPARWARSNYRGAAVSLVGGPAVALALGGVAVAGSQAGSQTSGRAAAAAAIAALGAGAVGCYDDLRGETATKGLGGHLRALAGGRVTTGAVKVLGLVLVAVAAALVLRGARPGALGEAVLIAGCANLVNLFDLCPGRALKVTLLAAAGLGLAAGGAARPVAAWLAGCTLGALPADLRERVMLGDAGANAAGAVLGVGLAAATRGVGLAVALAAVVALTLASEVVSFSRVVERVPPLRWADGLGRVRAGA